MHEEILKKVAVSLSAWLAVSGWALAWSYEANFQPEDWQAETERGRQARRWWWTAWQLLVMHVILAFTFVHGFSHQTAFKHVQQTSGFGEGIFISYGLIVMWMLEGLLWYAFPRIISVLPLWLRWSWRLVVALIVFNAAIVFAPEESRLAGILIFLALGYQIFFKPRESLPAIKAEMLED